MPSPARGALNAGGAVTPSLFLARLLFTLALPLIGPALLFLLVQLLPSGVLHLLVMPLALLFQLLQQAVIPSRAPANQEKHRPRACSKLPSSVHS
jgi:hypothetical protein